MVTGAVTTLATAAALSAAIAYCGGGGSCVSLSSQFSPSAAFHGASAATANNASITAATLAIALVAQPLALSAASSLGGESSASAWVSVGSALFEGRGGNKSNLRFFLVSVRAATLVGTGQALGALLAACAVVSGAKLPFVGAFASAALAGPWASPWASTAIGADGNFGTLSLLLCLATRAAVGDALVAAGHLQGSWRSARCASGRATAAWPLSAAAGFLGLGHSAATLSLAALVAASALSSLLSSPASLSASSSSGVVARVSASLLAPAVAAVALSVLAGELLILFLNFSTSTLPMEREKKTR